MFWIDHVGVVARDLDESVAFYTKLFGEPIDRVAWRGEHAANVALADIGATHFGFHVEDIDATVAQLGLEVSGAPSDLPIGPYRGGRSVYLKDPNGANIQLMQLAGRPGRMPVLRPGDPPAHLPPE